MSPPELVSSPRVTAVAAHAGVAGVDSGATIATLLTMTAAVRALQGEGGMASAARFAQLVDIEGQAARLLADALSCAAGIPAHGVAGWARLADGAREFYGALVDAHARLSGLAGVVADAVDEALPALAGAAAQRVKWELLSCGAAHRHLWLWLGAAYLAAGERFGGAVEREYLRAIAYHSAAFDQIERSALAAADLLVAQGLSRLQLRPLDLGDALYQVTPSSWEPPRRMLAAAGDYDGHFYFVARGAADMFAGLALQLARGQLPEAVATLSPEARLALPLACQHLLRQWGDAPPQRRVRRHLLDGRLAAVSGFAALRRQIEGGGVLPPAEWLMHDVSRGGIGALVPGEAAEAVEVGDLVGLRAADGDGWHLGIVRRKRFDGMAPRLGVETLSQKPRAVTANDGQQTFDALLCDPVRKGEAVRVLAPEATLQAGVTLFIHGEGAVHALKPLDATQGGRDFDLRVYQVL